VALDVVSAATTGLMVSGAAWSRDGTGPAPRASSPYRRWQGLQIRLNLLKFGFLKSSTVHTNFGTVPSRFGIKIGFSGG
jgi:hypothetical protein